MSERTGIEWTDATWQRISAAKRIGVSPELYTDKLRAGEKWCTRCKTWHPRAAFGVDQQRSDGLAAHCLASRRVKVKQAQRKRSLKGWLVPTRDGDKLQARRRVNYLVEQGRIPHPDSLPCMDCRHESDAHQYRHEYDHARGYDGENQLYVEVVCSKCHRNREEARNGVAA